MRKIMSRWLNFALMMGGFLVMAPFYSLNVNAIALHRSDVVVFRGGEGGNSNYRIPSIVVGNDGSLIAFSEGRGPSGDPGNGSPSSIMSRRSIDNGKTWDNYLVIDADENKAFSDPRPLVDKRTGRIFIFYTQWDINCAQNGNCVPFDDEHHKLLYKTSDDHGQSWSKSTNIIDQVRNVNWFVNGDANNNGRATWSISLDQNQIDLATSAGWELAWDSRVADGSCNIQSYSDGNTRYLVNLGVDDEGMVKAVLSGNGNKMEFPLNFDISAYHHYQIISNGHIVSFYVDYTLVTNDWSGQYNSQKKVTWGHCSSSEGSSAYQSVHFSIAGTSQANFDASLMARVNDTVINQPNDQGWKQTGKSKGHGSPGWKSINAGPGHGIQLQSGRLIIPAIVLDAFSHLSVVSIYSDDQGETWKAGQQTPTYAIEPSEADLVQLNDGRLLLSARNDGVTGSGNFNRYHYISENDGISWNVITETRDSVNGALFFKLDQVDIGLVRYDNNRILMSGPQGDGAVSSDRNDLAIWSAVGNGSGEYNFTQRTQFRDGYTGYSDIVVLFNMGNHGMQNIGVIYEAKPSTEIRFMLININRVK